MKEEDWLKRIAERNDVTGQLVHLTKASDEDGIEVDALDVLIKILNDKCIEGNISKSGFICGNRKAICFQDAPVYSLTQNIYCEQKMRMGENEKKIRYMGYGLLFSKPYVYNKNGRPVIYDRAEDAKKYLPKEEWWRIVNLDLSNHDNYIDWTHEREWRVPDVFKFELSEVAVVVPNEDIYKKFYEICDKAIIDEIKSVTNLRILFF